MSPDSQTDYIDHALYRHLFLSYELPLPEDVSPGDVWVEELRYWAQIRKKHAE